MSCGHTCRCYRSADDDAWVRFGLGPDEWIESIEVLAEKPHDASCDGAPTVRGRRFRTAKGVGLGSRRDEVVRLYGPPTSEERRGPGAAELRWETDVDHDPGVTLAYEARVLLRGGRVVAFEIYDGE